MTDLTFSESTVFPDEDDDHLIDLYFLESNVLAIKQIIEEIWSEIFKDDMRLNSLFNYVTPNMFRINSFHTGLGFVYHNNKDKFTLEYYGKNGFRYGMLPSIINQKDVLWANETVVGYQDDIWKHYWEQSTFVGTIKKSMLKDLKKFILKEFIPNNKFYSYFDVFKVKREQIPKEDEFERITDYIKYKEPFLKKSTCDTFSYSILNWIQQNGGNIKTITPLHETIAPIFCEDLQLLDFNKPEDKINIINFYSSQEEIFLEMYKEIEKIIVDAKQQAKSGQPIDKNMYSLIITQISNIIFSHVETLKKNENIIFHITDNSNNQIYYNIPLKNSLIFTNYVVSPFGYYNSGDLPTPPNKDSGIISNYRNIEIISIILLFLFLVFIFFFIYRLRKGGPQE